MRSTNKKNRYRVIEQINNLTVTSVNKMGKISKRILPMFTPVCFNNNVKTGTLEEKYNNNIKQKFKETVISSLMTKQTFLFLHQPGYSSTK